MPEYLIKFIRTATVGNKKEVMDELREHGGQYVRESRMRKGYVYNVPDERFNTNAFRTRNYIQSSEREPEPAE